MTAEEMVSRLLYRDGLMLVIDKPAGLAVHRGPNGGESLEDHFGALRFGLPRGPALAHRLDRDTSGCLVLGRHRKALAQLGRLFKNGAIDKTYWAVVENGPAASDGLIEFPLGRLDPTRGWWMRRDANGQAAVTRWKVLGRCPAHGAAAGSGTRVNAAAHLATPCPPVPAKGGGNFCWLALEPLTGRTHQLRVHCAEMGWPILGDTIYGKAPRHGGSTLHLHAREIVVPLYKNRAPIRVVAPLPPHMHARLRACGWRSDGKDAPRADDDLPSRAESDECSNRSSP
jgi:tRNA pseudouridine32 synthase / 23S rRNA pseudouridine746 synthase